MEERLRVIVQFAARYKGREGALPLSKIFSPFIPDYERRITEIESFYRIKVSLCVYRWIFS